MQFEDSWRKIGVSLHGEEREYTEMWGLPSKAKRGGFFVANDPVQNNDVLTVVIS